MTKLVHPRRLTFWFDFASTYSYLSLQRIEAAAAQAGVEVDWRPFLLGPIFEARGWGTSPFRVYLDKGAHMFRDLERRAEAMGLPFHRGAEMPANSVQAARLAIAAFETPALREHAPAFCRAISFAHWGQGGSLADPETLAGAARSAGLDPEALVAAAGRAEVKPLLRAYTEAAQAQQIFGAPSFTVGEGAARELFWGDDQLDDALAWAATGRLAPRPAVAPPGPIS